MKLSDTEMMSFLSIELIFNYQQNPRLIDPLRQLRGKFVGENKSKNEPK